MAKDQGTPTPQAVAEAAQTRVAFDSRAVTLIGLMTGPKGGRALLRDANGRFHTVEPGDRVGAQVVAAIDTASMILTRGGQTQRLALSDSATGRAAPDNGLKRGR